MSLKPKELEELKELLLAEKKRIQDHLRHIKNPSTDSSVEQSGDMADVAEKEQSQKALEKVGDRDKRLLGEINAALAKFEDGTYGICEHSGEDIPLARLRVRPFTRYTVESQEYLEREEKKFRKSRDDAAEEADALGDDGENP